MPKFIRDTKLGREQVLDFFRRLDPSLLHMEQLKLNNHGELSDVLDSVYRVFHNSFKMYSFRPLRYVEAMLRPLGYEFESQSYLDAHTHPSEPYGMGTIDLLKEWKVSDVFIDLIRPAQAIKWNYDRNQHDNWVADARVILAGTLTAREVAACTHDAMDRMLHGEGFLWDVKNEFFLSDSDAMFMDVWAGLGLRYNLDPSICEEAREILKPKLKTRPPPEDY